MKNYTQVNVFGTRILSASLFVAMATLTLAGLFIFVDASAIDGDHMQDATGLNTTVTNQVIRKGWGFMPGNGKFAIEDTPIDYGITFDELPFLIVKFANSKQVADGDPTDLSDCSITRNVIAAGVNQTTSGFKPILRTPTGLGFPSVTNYCYTWIAIGRDNASYNGEEDPVFSVWDKSTGISITESQISDLAHTTDADISAMGYIKSYTETDPGFTAWDKSTGISITESQITDLSHTSDADISAMGYIKSYTETDPGFTAWDKSTGISITESQISDLAHTTDADISAMGYIKSYTEMDPEFSAWDRSTGISITESQISDLDHFTNADETDPTVPLGVKDGVDWSELENGKEIFMDYRPDNVACGSSQVLKYDATNARWLCANEADPVFTAWDKSTGISITESQISDLSHTNDADIAAMGYIKSYTETDPEVGANTTNYLSKWSGTQLISSSIFDNGNVGIGTTDPKVALTIKNNSLGDSGRHMIRLIPGGVQGRVYITSPINYLDFLKTDENNIFLDYMDISAKNGYFSGNVSAANGTFTGNVGIGGILNPASALHVGGYIQLATVSGSPPPTDCDETSERGRMKVDDSAGLIYVCVQSGWTSK